MKRTLTLFTLLAITIIGCSQEVGTIAPDFTLKNTNNVDFTLSNHLGKVTVVFFLGYACPSCRAIAPDVQTKLVDAFGSNQNFQLIGIDTWNGTTAQVKGFITGTNTSFDILQQGSSVASSWGTTYDRLIILDAEGKFVFKGSGLVSSHIDAAVEEVKSLLSSTTAINEIKSTDPLQLSIFPNPVQSTAQVRIHTEESTSGKLTIYNATGKLAYSNTIQLAQGENQITLPVQQLSSGVYLLQVATNTDLLRGRFTVE